MSVVKIVEITSSSSKGFDDAVKDGISRASKTLRGIKGAWIKEQKVVVNKGKVIEFRVTMKVSFQLD